MKNIFDQIISILKNILIWTFSHKKIVFIYFPAVCSALLAIYIGIIYLSWQSDREAAFEKMAKYKKLIDQTEEMKVGRVYSYSEVDATSKVVDIPTRIYGRNGEVIGEYFEQKREIIPFSHIPKTLVQAVIASEDRDFYEHSGINYKGIFRAFLLNLYHLRVVQGGSTITQQLAKVLFTDMERSIKRKVYEAFCAKEIESKYDKDDIISMYLNLIYFGNGSYGVESTAKMFFGKSAKELNETECAAIVATISNPMIYSPLNNLNNSVRKTKRILKSLVDAKYVNKNRAAYQYKKYLQKWDVKFDEKGKATSSLIGSFLYSSYRINRAPFFNEQIRRIMVDKFGEAIVKKGGLSIYTTIDEKKQDIAVKSLREGIERQRKFHLQRATKISSRKKSDKEKEKSKNIQGALISINPHNGEIISYVGGYKFTSTSQLDHIVQARRQPGSSFKPLLYCSAIENKDITASTSFIDEETEFEDGYKPNNYGKKFHGKMIVRNALRKSVNIIAVKILKKTGYDTLIKYLQNSLDLSDSEIDERFQKTLSMALGTYEVTPLENVILHSTLVNGGNYIKPFGIKYVKNYNDKIIWNYEEEVAAEIENKRDKYGKIIDPIAASITISLLKGVLQDGGTAGWVSRAYKLDFPVAGKTGTSTNYNDAWFVGYTDNQVTATWVGNNKGAISLGRGRSGGSVAAPIWGRYISEINLEEKPGDFPVPEEGISYQTICMESGMVPQKGNYCPETSVNELFYSGTEPGEYCKIHTELISDNDENSENDLN